MSRHRGAKPPRRCGLLGEIILLSPGKLLSVERRHFHSHTAGSLTPTFVTARGAKPPRRCGLLGEIILLSPGKLLSVERRHFHSHTAGSLTPTFVTARTVILAVRLVYAFTLSARFPSVLSDRSVVTFWRLRFFLGGYRPSQTAHLTIS